MAMRVGGHPWAWAVIEYGGASQRAATQSRAAGHGCKKLSKSAG